jgi:SAM-dependent methyltransferase
VQIFLSRGKLVWPCTLHLFQALKLNLHSNSNNLQTDAGSVSQDSSIIEPRQHPAQSDIDIEQLVQEGYDKIALRYLEWSTSSPARLSYLNKLLGCLPKLANVLELGCGAAKPCTQILAEHAEVTGVDISAAQLALAKQLVPKAQLIHADMMSLTFPSNTFDAVVAFYSIIHIPREKQDVLISRIVDWLRPGGLLLANFGTTDDPGSINQDWLGSKMYWSSYNVPTNEEMLIRAGFELLEAEVLEDNEDGKRVPFYWVLARKTDLFVLS